MFERTNERMSAHSQLCSEDFAQTFFMRTNGRPSEQETEWAKEWEWNSCKFRLRLIHCNLNYIELKSFVEFSVSMGMTQLMYREKSWYFVDALEENIVNISTFCDYYFTAQFLAHGLLIRENLSKTLRWKIKLKKPKIWTRSISKPLEYLI